MRGIHPDTQKDLQDPKKRQICARREDGGCAGRITIEHPILFAGRQLHEHWAEIKLCERHHSVGKYMENGALDKQKNIWIALCQATIEELRGLSKIVDYIELRDKLNKKYGLE